jgi:hypothetical protein
MGTVIEQALGLTVAGKDVGEHITSGAADVYDGAEVGKVISFGHGWGFGAMDADHGFAKERRFFVVFGEVIEKGLAVGLFKGGVAGLERVHELAHPVYMAGPTIVRMVALAEPGACCLRAALIGV